MSARPEGGRGTRSPGAGGGARTQQRESDGLVHSHAHSLAHFCTQIIAHRDSIRNNRGSFSNKVFVSIIVLGL